jgi:hypothetical protein
MRTILPAMPHVPISRKVIAVVLGAAAIASYFAALRIMDKPLKAAARERTFLQAHP